MKGSSRIGGDYNLDALEAFRAAYGQQLMVPQDHDIDARVGLPTENISNTSPWIESTGIWKYPSGKGPESDLQAPFNPGAYYTQETEEPETVNIDEMNEEEFDEYLDSLSSEELEALSEQLELGESDNYDEESDEDLTEEEVESLINELLGQEQPYD